MKRLYVGGLGHTVSQKDLRDRFGKFGEVADVEIITRNDEHGAPFKTFGYINIDISDSDFKRCVSVLNKSKWKGGTLQIELAKESFLHRLSEERQQVTEKVQIPTIDPKDKMVDSLKAAGIENFHMKSAVPGTEIPGHKNWVVSKFGRVLPVLHLKHQGKNKVFKYDPSKHCHNIKKLDPTEDSTSVDKLTWEIDGGNDEMSKKRRGEFPPQKKRLKTKVISPKRTAPCGVPKLIASEKKISVRVGQSNMFATGKLSHIVQTCVLGSDADSDDEIRMLVAQECLQDRTSVCAEDDGNLEVVGDDFVVKSSMFWRGGQNSLNTELCLKTSNPDEEYDSADTDEILNQNKNESKADGLTEEMPVYENTTLKSSTDKVKKGKKKAARKNRKTPSTQLAHSDESSSESLDSEYEAMMGNCPRLDLSLTDLEHLVQNLGESASEEDDALNDSGAGPSDLPTSSPRCRTIPPRVLPPRSSSEKMCRNPDDILASLLEPDTENEEKRKDVAKLSLPAFVGTKDLFDSVPTSSGSSLKRPAKSVVCELKEDHKRLKQDSKTLLKQCALEGRPKDQMPEPLHQEDMLEKITQFTPTDSSSESGSSSDEVERDHVHKDQALAGDLPQADHSSSGRILQDEHIMKEDITLPSEVINFKLAQAGAQLVSSASSSSSTSTGESEMSEEEEENDANVALGASNVPGPKQTSDKTASSFHQSATSDPAKQQQDNLKRLAALEQRQKQTEQQKKLIQGALATLDYPNANKGKHIMFDSDDEVNDEEENPSGHKKSLLEESVESDEDVAGAQGKEGIKRKEYQKAGCSKLFDSSEDEDDGKEKERFQIKPQFEGKAGQKLMELQSRFGTDSRFQMDAKFLESDGETEDSEAESPGIAPGQELVEEKKKNLAIMQNVLDVNVQPSNRSKAQRKGKTFRDISALHYDPTEETHTTFETKTEPPKKESKAARRKKREEAKKLPDVSNTIYYDVTVDLKESFGALKDKNDKEDEKQEIPWDKDDEDEDEATDRNAHLPSSEVETEKEPTSGFKFLFFGGAAAPEVTPKTDEYRIETLKGAKLPWHVDPRFHDSSSEDEEDVGEEEEEKDQTDSITSAQEPAPPKKFFFFYEGDIRLKEGPGMFCRSEKMEHQRDAWEEKRATLIEDYRKKHRDARRRQHVSVKS